MQYPKRMMLVILFLSFIIQIPTSGQSNTVSIGFITDSTHGLLQYNRTITLSEALAELKSPWVNNSEYDFFDISERIDPKYQTIRNLANKITNNQGVGLDIAEIFDMLGISPPDYLFLTLAINDFYYNNGGIFKSSYSELIEYVNILSKNQTKIVLVTFPYFNATRIDEYYNVRSNWNILEEYYYNAYPIISETYNLPIIDFNRAMANRSDYKELLQDDGLNLSDKGVRFMAEYIDIQFADIIKRNEYDMSRPNYTPSSTPSLYINPAPSYQENTNFPLLGLLLLFIGRRKFAKVCNNR